MRITFSKTFFLVSAIVIFAFILRVYMLGVIPPGMTNDEADIGYDAYSILKTGHDQWNSFMPMTAFKGFGDYRLPLYTYLVIPSIAVFDLTSFAVRLPSAIFGTVSVLLIYFLVKILFKKDSNATIIGIFAMLFMAISPWSIGLSRIGIESNTAITFILGGIIAFLYASRKPWLYVVSSFLFAITLYTYTSYTLFTPFVVVILAIFFKNDVIKHKKMILFSLLLFFLLVSPLFIFRSAVGTRASQVSLFTNQDSIGLLANLNDKRGSCVEKYPAVFCKIVENKGVLFAGVLTANYLNHFSIDFLYINGTTTQYSILPPRGLFYLFEMAFVGVGFIYALRKGYKPGIFIIVLIFLAPIPDALTSDGHFSRASNMLPYIFILEGIGAAYIWETLHRFKGMEGILRGALGVLVTLSCIMFLVSYTSYFPVYFSSFSQYGYQDWARKINEQKDNYDKIYLSRVGNDTKQYIYYLFFTKYDPKLYQTKSGVEISDDNGWVSVDRIGNLLFTRAMPSESALRKLSSKKILLVTHPIEFPKLFKDENAYTVKDKNGNVVFIFEDAAVLINYYDKTKEEVPPLE